MCFWKKIALCRCALSAQLGTDGGRNQLRDICVPARRGWVGKASPHMARDGGLLLAVLYVVKPSSGGCYQLSGSWSYLPLRALCLAPLWRTWGRAVAGTLERVRDQAAADTQLLDYNRWWSKHLMWRWTMIPLQYHCRIRRPFTVSLHKLAKCRQKSGNGASLFPVLLNGRNVFHKTVLCIEKTSASFSDIVQQC